MPSQSSLASVDLDIEVGRKRSAGREEPETSFRVLIVGDFSGRASRGVSERLTGRKALLVDRDNFDQVMQRLGVEARIPVDEQGAVMSLRFKELDDFHPDRLYDLLQVFQDLRDLRGRLEDPATFKKEAQTMRAAPPAPRPGAAPARPAIPDLVSGNLLDQVAEETGQGTGARPSRAPDPIRAYVNEIVAPYLTPGADPKQAELIAQVDAATSGQMSALLHHPYVQSLEAAWRALYFIVRGIETGTHLKLYVLDAAPAELAADLGGDSLRRSALYRLLVEEAVETPGADPWSLIVGLYTFRPSMEHVDLLARMGMIARKARAPFLSAAHPQMLGCASLVAAPHPRDWKTQPALDELRSLPEAAWIGLAAPRFLLRLPYGPKTDSCERFDFDEMAGAPVHDDYLWGNPAIFAATLIAQTFSEFGWPMRPGAIQNMRGLPLHIYKEDGDSVAKPCAEVLLTEQAATAMIDRGLMPLLSMKGTDTVRLGMVQSVAGKALEGRWG